MWEQIVIAVTSLLGQGLDMEWKKLSPSPVQKAEITDNNGFRLYLADGRKLGLKLFRDQIFYEAGIDRNRYSGMVHPFDQTKAGEVCDQAIGRILTS